jgi:hypothetical protein
VRLIIYYVALALVGDAIAVTVCLSIEKFWLAGSMPIFIGLYFVVLWAAWVVAVRLTEPETKPAKAAAHSQPAE